MNRFQRFLNHISFDHRVCVTGLLFCAGLITGLWSHSATSEPAIPTDKIIHMVSTEWPPYSGATLPGQGWTSIAVRRAFELQDVDTVIGFLPWRRALDTVLHQKSDAIFPVYDAKTRREQFLLSDPISTSPIGFVIFRGYPFDWKTTADLQKFVIGVIGGYVNTPEIDALIQSEQLNIIEGNDETALLRLLAAGRIDAAIMDQLVARHLLDTGAEFSETRRWFGFHPNYLAYKSLHVGFQRSATGLKFRSMFNHGLAEFNCQDIDCNTAWPHAPFTFPN